MREVFRNLTGARGLLLCAVIDRAYRGIRIANEDKVAARSSGNTLGVKRSADHNAVDKTVPPAGRCARAGQGQDVKEWVCDIVVGLHMRTVDESHDDVVHTGFRLDRN